MSCDRCGKDVMVIVHYEGGEMLCSDCWRKQMLRPCPRCGNAKLPDTSDVYAESDCKCCEARRRILIVLKTVEEAYERPSQD